MPVTENVPKSRLKNGLHCRQQERFSPHHGHRKCTLAMTMVRRESFLLTAMQAILQPRFRDVLRNGHGTRLEQHNLFHPSSRREPEPSALVFLSSALAVGDLCTPR